MAIETALRVRLPNRPGELARVARQLADAGVNIRSVAGVAGAGEGSLEFRVDSLGAAIGALMQGGTTFQEVRVVVSPIPSGVPDQPGTLARLAEKLAAAGINIESLYIAIGPGDQPQAVLGCSDPEKAEPILASWGA
jgi:hypothetical protein